jgi:hypothetical protein
MDDRELERRLKEYDFSRLSPVREPLLQKLLSLRNSQGMIAKSSESLWAQRLNDEELDMAAAAGNPMMMATQKDKNKGQK